MIGPVGAKAAKIEILEVDSSKSKSRRRQMLKVVKCRRKSKEEQGVLFDSWTDR